MPSISNAEAAELAKLPAYRPVTLGVNKLLSSLTLDPAGEARAALARSLAHRIDRPGCGSTSHALLSRELRAVLADILDPDAKAAAANVVKGIFSA
jgi:hypothetical protein